MIAPSLPTTAELQPFLDRLEANAGSVVLIAIELPANRNYPRVGIGHFSADARKRLRRALKGEGRAVRQAIVRARRKRRALADELVTITSSNTESPNDRAEVKS